MGRIRSSPVRLRVFCWRRSDGTWESRDMVGRGRQCGPIQAVLGALGA